MSVAFLTAAHQNAAIVSNSFKKYISSHSEYIFCLLLLGIGCMGMHRSIFLIYDEVVYFEQAYALYQHSTDSLAPLKNHFSFPWGTALWSVLVYYVVGFKFYYLPGLLSLIFSILLLTRIFDRMDFPRYTAFLVLFFPPVLILSHTMMSDIHVLLLSSAFFYMYLKEDKNSWHTFIYSFIATFSLLYREPAILVFLPFLVYDLFVSKDKSVLIVGLILGLMPRLISSLYLFGDAFYVKDPGYAFGIDGIWTNMIGYTGILILSFPMLLFIKPTVKNPLEKLIIVTILANILFYASYQYNGLNSGLLRGVVLGPRFLIPILPLVIFWIGKGMHQNATFIQWSYLIPVTAVCVFGGTQYLVYQYNAIRYNTLFTLQKYDWQNIKSNDNGELAKYINSLYFPKEEKNKKIAVENVHVHFLNTSIFNPKIDIVVDGSKHSIR